MTSLFDPSSTGCIGSHKFRNIIIQPNMTTVHNSFAQLEISYPNLLHNYNYFRSKLKPTTKMLILVKANAYGHGAVEFAKAMVDAGANYLAVAHPIEGVELRNGGIDAPILVLTAGTDYFRLLTDYKLEPSIPTIEALSMFDKHLCDNGISRYPVHIKLDTGMHRLGFMEHELPPLLDFIKNHERIEVKSVFSHLSVSDVPGQEEYTLRQIKLFSKMAPQVDSAFAFANPDAPKPLHHILNSAGIEKFSDWQFDMVRLGIGIYGISNVDMSLVKPVASLKCNILQIKHLKPGEGDVGYGRWGKITKPATIATLPLGYADGINRHFGRGNAKFMLNGHLVPTIGNICMDMFMVDITGVEAKVGDTVTVFGDNPKVSDLAKILDTIPYEVFTSVDRRVKRVMVR
jgi:Alr-MurF fusion protein